VSFDFDFTADKLAKCFPNNAKAADWYPSISTNLPDYGITSLLRVAQWLAQIGHESGDLRWTSENLNYGAQGLRRVFPKYFPTDALAQQYERQPSKIANLVYGSRMGNGPESSGDGFRFRGRGLVQVTGKSNYTACSTALYGDPNILLDNPDILAEPDGAVRSACWYWNSRKINPVADREDTKEVTRLINGGSNGLQDRIDRYAAIKRILGS
jgi:putative chitinase